MSNVLIRDVPTEDLEQIRAAAADEGTSVQAYLLAALRAQAAYLRRRAALTGIAERMQTGPAVPEAERAAVLDAIDADHRGRAAELGNRPAR